MKTWIKEKYTQRKTKGKYKSKHNSGKRSEVPRRKATDKERAEMKARQPTVTMVVQPSGKRRFVRE